MDKLLPERRPRIERSENIPAGDVEKPRDAAENLALGALARSRRTEDDERRPFDFVR